MSDKRFNGAGVWNGKPAGRGNHSQERAFATPPSQDPEDWLIELDLEEEALDARAPRAGEHPGFQAD